MQTVVTEAEEKRYAELQQMALAFARNGETEPLASMLDAGLPVNLSDANSSSRAVRSLGARSLRIWATSSWPMARTICA